MRTLTLAILLSVVFTSSGVHSLSADEQTDRVVNAANALLNTLSDSEKSKVQFKFNDEQQRLRWSNLPTGIFERRGLRMGDLKPQQSEAVMNVLKATLSEKGFQQIVDNVAAEETLNRGGQRGRIVFGEDEFYFSILGTPSSTDAWMWQFGGHHLAINATIVGDHITLGPSLTGGQPMHFTRDGQQVAQMAEEVALAFELVNSLDAAQQKKAVLGDRFADMILGPGKDDFKPAPEGIAGKDLTESQVALLKRLLAERVNLLNPDDATSRMKSFESQLPETFFSWRGPTKSGSPAYYRVQGPGVFLEFAPQQMGGAPTEHIHAMYREFGNDYGEAWFKGQ